MMVKDTKKSTPSTTLNIFNIPESIIPEDKLIYAPNWDNKPPPQKDVVKVQGKRVLSVGNMLSLISKAGTGKSGICECFVASVLNPKCDSLGIETTLPVGRDKVLFIDTERSLQDTWNSWERIYRRANIDKPKIDNRVIVLNVRKVAMAERKKHVLTILKENKDIGLIIFDGASDFIRDTNSIEESNQFTDWINTFNPNISIVVTLHVNPSDNKPRGHLGSELLRRSESVFLARKLDGVAEITTIFEHGKVRNDDDNITIYYKYSDEFKMFHSTEYTPQSTVKKEKTDGYRDMAQQIFENQVICSSSFVINKISEIAEKTPVAAKGIFFRYFANKLLTKSDDGWKLA
jgi:hypothetical protein